MDRDDERVSVKVHLPQWQKEQWVSHADRCDMTQSEFVRSMVQAGRREFDGQTDAPVETESSDVTPRSNAFETQVLDVLENEGYLTWDELLTGVTTEIEDQLETALDTLQSENKVKYSGRNGGYTVREEAKNDGTNQ